MFYIKQIATIPCSIHILHVSGTVIFIQQKAIEWDRKFYIKEQEEAEKRGTKAAIRRYIVRDINVFYYIGQIYSSIDKIEASKKTLAALQ
jgi:hypothetical protein